MRSTLLLCMFLLTTALALAGDATLTWDQSPTPGVTHNTVYWGDKSGGPYGFQIKIPAMTTYTVRDLALGTWYFVVTASKDNLESGPSNEASKTIVPPVQPPSPPANLKEISVNVTVTIK